MIRANLDEFIRRMNETLIDCISGPLRIRSVIESLEIKGHCDRFSRFSCSGVSGGGIGKWNDTFLYECEDLGTDH
jgi:hypothetical protein